jgi:putative serine protease PepD
VERVPAGRTDGQPPQPADRRSRRLLASGIAAVVVLLAVIAILALELSGKTTAASAPATAGRPSPTATPTLTVPAIYQRVTPSVVVIRTNGDLGTGVIVASDGTILTADHVIARAKTITVTFADGTTTQASVASADPKHDIAMLTPAKLPQVVVPADLGGGTDIGSDVVAIGNPIGLAYSVSSGVISGLDRTASTDNGQFSGLIQFDASVNPGSSGGPLLNSRGVVIGIVVALANPAHDDAFAGIAFAVPIATALGGPGRGPQI